MPELNRKNLDAKIAELSDEIIDLQVQVDKRKGTIAALRRTLDLFAGESRRSPEPASAPEPSPEIAPTPLPEPVAAAAQQRPSAKKPRDLPEATVRAIRRDKKLGLSHRKLAENYGISSTAVGRIAAWETYHGLEWHPDEIEPLGTRREREMDEAAGAVASAAPAALKAEEQVTPPPASPKDVELPALRAKHIRPSPPTPTRRPSPQLTRHLSPRPDSQFETVWSGERKQSLRDIQT